MNNLIHIQKIIGLTNVDIKLFRDRDAAAGEISDYNERVSFIYI